MCPAASKVQQNCRMFQGQKLETVIRRLGWKMWNCLPEAEQKPYFDLVMDRASAALLLKPPCEPAEAKFETPTKTKRVHEWAAVGKSFASVCSKWTEGVSPHATKGKRAVLKGMASAVLANLDVTPSKAVKRKFGSSMYSQSAVPWSDLADTPGIPWPSLNHPVTPRGKAVSDETILELLRAWDLVKGLMVFTSFSLI